MKNSETKRLIDQLSGRYVDNDPRFMAAAKKHTEFEQQLTQRIADISHVEEQIAAMESKSAGDLLAGGTVDVRGIARLREKKADHEEEARILKNVIEQAKLRSHQLKEQIKQEYALRSWETMAVAFREMISALAVASDCKSTLQAGHALPYLSLGGWGLPDVFREFDKIVEAFAKFDGYAKDTVAELKGVVNAQPKN